MPSNFSFGIPTPSGLKNFTLASGTSILFVGANGCGKTRLAVRIEDTLGSRAHRISAHRALNLNSSVSKISEEQALNALRTGGTYRGSNRTNSRWSNQSPIHLLNDYDYLIQALFAEQSNKALETHKKARKGDITPPKPTKFEILTEIWERLIPHRRLIITGDQIEVKSVGDNIQYPAREMSDGERAIFYLIGQTLCTVDNSVLIIDEPELHIHKSIMSSLWDELEAIRPDCAFIFISHDLEFVASRIGEKYIIREFNNISGGQWIIEDVPETGFGEEITTKILGSRRPILFVEGTSSSLDYAIYRNCYPDWTVIPRGSCESVIHSVVTMRSNAALTRITCSGIVDADDYSHDEISYLNTLGIKVLPTSEIENLFLLPDIVTAIGRHEGHDNSALVTILQQMTNDVISDIQHGNNLEKVITRYCRRRIDRLLKKIDLSSASTVADIATEYTAETSALDIVTIATAQETKINNCITNRDITGLMSLYDNKGLLAIAARHLRATSRSNFESWIIRVLGNNSVSGITNAFKSVLPTIVAS